MYTREEAEGRRLKNPFDTITEGVGINRLTKNFMMAELDGAFRGTDMEAIEMSRLGICSVPLLPLLFSNYGFSFLFFSPNFLSQLVFRFLLRNDGLFLGSSSALNCVGAVQVAQSMGPGHTIVTILCDSGMRHLSKFYSAQYLSHHGLEPSATGLEFIGVG